MSRSLPAALLLELCLIILPASVTAQALTVQQPVVETFGVNTVVTVPDQGAVFLGGVSSGADSSFNSAFMPFGSSIGSQRSHSNAWARVYIHDFEAMDEALLSAGQEQPLDSYQTTNPLAAHAYRSLLNQPGRISSTPLVRGTTPNPSARPSGASVARTIDRNLSAVHERPERHTETFGRRSPAASPASSSLRFERPTQHAEAIVRERFGRGAQSEESSLSESSTAAASRSTNSGDSPAANRASR